MNLRTGWDGMMPFLRTRKFLGCVFVQTESQLGPSKRMTVSVSVTAAAKICDSLRSELRRRRRRRLPFLSERQPVFGGSGSGRFVTSSENKRTRTTAFELAMSSDHYLVSMSERDSRCGFANTHMKVHSHCVPSCCRIVPARRAWGRAHAAFAFLTGIVFKCHVK